MFGIGFEELIILAILAFILFGPEKLPDYAATLGKFIAKMRQTSSELTQQYQNPFQQSPESAPRPAPESVCPHCQHIVTQDFTFCPECGQRLKKDHYPPPPQESACPYCRQKVDLDAVFCSKCGQRLKEEHYPPQQPQAS